ncbi:MBL fold metallo-hydrolase [Candidatus Bathyarchaeota archaeon]|nr:MBL fold metallo-hydrolase [Candidatus Bathyarchaeota archaeon]NIU81075.1 MBL fold metallo-hydrolase [Candidatus Bathyarchaeota archaeon]NIV68153.1 MBL fold metallo-hydrolase [Candidatus Bathyarchaeota archaeon]NIW16526.1 MBL fold metallo-hydrolase [Candidatus Bathyarchaeota archaeon]NIW34668.1 MBL fold metallo-hydrolase [Candidatus Bathyarchaeota archaeon]
MLTVGALQTNCYLVGCPESLQGLIIDPGFSTNREAQTIMEKVEEHNLTIKYIVNTHGHPDHTSGNGILKEKTGASLLIHELDAPKLTNTSQNLSALFGLHVNSPSPDQTLQEGDLVQVGGVKLKVLHTPGHSKGGICLLAEKVIFTGDTLFAGSIGRYDFPDANLQEIMKSLKRLTELPDHLKVYPGHGPSSTLGEEKRSNPFLRT